MPEPEDKLTQQIRALSDSASLFLSVQKAANKILIDDIERLTRENWDLRAELARATALLAERAGL